MSQDALSSEIAHDVNSRYKSQTPYSSRDFENMNDEEHALVLRHSARLQRIRPEDAMNAIQAKLGSGVYSHAVEHIGDLYHRAQEMPAHLHGENYGHGIQHVKQKINSVLSDLTRPYGFEREMKENLTANSQYNNDKSINWDSAVALGKDYAHEHSLLPVYNHPAHLMTQATQHLGNMRFGAATAVLQQLQPHANFPNRPRDIDMYPDDPDSHAMRDKWEKDVDAHIGKWNQMHTRQASIDFLKSIGR